MKRFSIIPLAVLAFPPLTDATAQVQQPPVERGARVRVTRRTCPPTVTCVGGSPQQYVGTFVTWEADTLVVYSNGDTLSVPANLVTRLAVSRGRKTNTGTGSVIGLLVGGVVGAIIGYASYEECVPRGFSFSCIGAVDPELYALGGGIIGGLVGGGVGALIGASIRTDRWQEMPLDHVRVSVGPQRDARFGLGLSVRF